MEGISVASFCDELTKLSGNVEGIPGLAGDNGTTIPGPTPQGTEGRLLKLQAPRNKIKQMQGPRAHAPRLGPPGT